MNEIKLGNWQASYLAAGQLVSTGMYVLSATRVPTKQTDLAQLHRYAKQVRNYSTRLARGPFYTTVRLIAVVTSKRHPTSLMDRVLSDLRPQGFGRSR